MQYGCKMFVKTHFVGISFDKKMLCWIEWMNIKEKILTDTDFILNGEMLQYMFKLLKTWLWQFTRWYCECLPIPARTVKWRGFLRNSFVVKEFLCTRTCMLGQFTNFFQCGVNAESDCYIVMQLTTVPATTGMCSPDWPLTAWNMASVWQQAWRPVCMFASTVNIAVTAHPLISFSVRLCFSVQDYLII